MRVTTTAGRGRVPACVVCGLALGLLLAGPARAQEDAPGARAVADSLLGAGGLPTVEPPVAPSPVDLWNTGLSPTAAVAMTPVFPGWGQLYARNSWQAAVGFGVSMYFWSNMLVRDRRAVRAKDFSESFAPDNVNRDLYRAIADENWAQMRDFAWWSGGVLLITALDAYVGAHLFNFGQDPVPVPDKWDDVFGRASAVGHGPGDGLSVVVFQWRKRF